MTLSDEEIAKRWEEEAQLLPFKAAERVRTAAQTWTGYISALLGVVGLAGVAFVPDQISKVAPAAQPLVIGMGLAVVLLGLAALVLAARAAGSVPGYVWNDGRAYRDASKKAADAGMTQLAWSRNLTSGAVACLLLAAALAAFTHDPAPAYAIVYQAGGPALCGTPVTDAGGVVSLRIGDTTKALAQPIGISPVRACPASPAK